MQHRRDGISARGRDPVTSPRMLRRPLVAGQHLVVIGEGNSHGGQAKNCTSPMSNGLGRMLVFLDQVPADPNGDTGHSAKG